MSFLTYVSYMPLLIDGQVIATILGLIQFGLCVELLQEYGTRKMKKEKTRQ